MTGPKKIDIQPQGIKKGDFITVVEWLSHVDFSYTRSVLEVIETDGQLLSCKPVTSGIADNIVLNMNNCKVRTVSKEFADSCRVKRKA